MTRVLLAALVLSLPIAASAQPIRVLDLDNRPVDPLTARPGTNAIVLVFTTIECPLANRYAPEIRRLYDTFAARGVRFVLVYPNPADEPRAIRAHQAAFQYPATALRDPKQDLVKRAQATVTPEAAVFTRDRRLAYRGPIDDRYVDLGVERHAPTRHHLADAIEATLAGRPAPKALARAVGCAIADFAR